MQSAPEHERDDWLAGTAGEQVLTPPPLAPPAPPVRAPKPLPTPAATSQITVEIVDDLVAVDRFVDFHRAHEAHPESRFDLLHAAFTNGRAAQPFFVMVRCDGRPCLLLVAQLVRGRVPWRLGYRTLHASRARTIEVLQGGWLGDRSLPYLERLCDHLHEYLRRGGADAVHLRHVPAGSPQHELFARRPRWPWRDRMPQKGRNWQLTLPASFEQWQRERPRREREDTRRYGKRIHKEFGDSVRVDLHQLADVDRAAAIVEGIARKTYQRGIGAGFRDTAEVRGRWRAAAAQDALDVRILWLGDVAVAFSVGFLFDGTLWLEHIGYDPACRRLRPGTFLLEGLIEGMVRRGNVHTIDFGIGDADYKRRLCDRSREDVSVYMFAPTLRGLWLNSMRSLANGCHRTGQALLDRLGLLPWFKSRSRRRREPKEIGSEQP